MRFYFDYSTSHLKAISLDSPIGGRMKRALDLFVYIVFWFYCCCAPATRKKQVVHSFSHRYPFTSKEAQPALLFSGLKIHTLYSQKSFGTHPCRHVSNRRTIFLEMKEKDSDEQTPLIEVKNDRQQRTTRQPQEDSNNALNEAPVGRKILELAIPAAGALLIDPLMNLADTAFVGRFSNNASELAGMGSASAVLTFSFYLFNFLCTATTPLVASKKAEGREEEAVKLGGQALTLALVLGATLSVVLLVSMQSLLRVMGTGSTGEEANMYALQFLGIRALAAPAVLSIEASTGVLRGYLDTKTPVVILILANIINLTMDVILIAFAGMGPMGAAIATTSAEWISATLFLLVLAGKIPSSTDGIGRKLLANGETLAFTPSLSIPSFSDIKPLLVASGSIFFRTLVLQISLSGAAAMAARGGTMDTGAAASVAAHQVGIQIWLLGSFLCDSLAAASQGLIADSLGRQDNPTARIITSTVLQYSFMLGVVLACFIQIGESTGWLLSAFTGDNETQEALSRILPLIVLAQPVNAIVFAADGIIQGASEFPFQAKAMAISGGTAVLTFLVLEHTQSTDTLVHVWEGLLALQLSRGLTSFWRIIDRNGPINIFSLK